MAMPALVGYCTAFILLIILLTVFAVIKSEADAGFYDWHVVTPHGPVWQISMFCFTYCNLMSDVVFIRMWLVFGVVLVNVWDAFGDPSWPHLWFDSLAGIHVDGLFWAVLQTSAALIPLLRQLGTNDSKVTFKVQERYEEPAERIWSEWWRRSGIPRADFKIILEQGEFLELPPGARVPMQAWEVDAGNVGDSESSNPGNGNVAYDTYLSSSLFYYVFSGQIHCRAHTCVDGRKDFTVGEEEFLDALPLLGLMGQSSVCLAMQTQPVDACVGDKGAVVVRWTAKALARKVLSSNGFAPQCLRLIVTQSTVDAFYRSSVAPSHRQHVNEVEQRRQELHCELVPKDAAMPKRSFFTQFWLSHISWRDLWAPSPQQRVVNAITTGSQEFSLLNEIRECSEEILMLRHASNESRKGCPRGAGQGHA